MIGHHERSSVCIFVTGQQHDPFPAVAAGACAAIWTQTELPISFVWLETAVTAKNLDRRHPRRAMKRETRER